MDYKLALSLKEAGFPIIEHANRAPEPRTFATSYPSHEVFYIPTLEELIEACGKDFFQLTKGSACWYAEPDIELQPPNMSQIVQGSTPTEAVARLWLALQKKNPA